MLMVTGYTNFFKNKWANVYDEEPAVDELNKKLQDAVKIQSYIVFFDKKKNELVKILASYWVPSDNIIMKVDVETKSCVTFYTPQDLPKN